MEQNLTETELSQHHQHNTENDSESFSQDNDHSIDDHQSETVDEILAHEAENLGNWEDVLAEEEDLPTLENGAPEEQQQLPAPTEQPPLPIVQEVYHYKLAIVRGSDLTLCQVPDKPPFNLLVFELPDAVTEEELYMLFGGKRAIDCHMYRRDLREIIFGFRKKGHLIEALLKENMMFKEKPLRLALILFGYQIDKFHFHNQKHTEFDLKMIPFSGAFEKCHERLEDGSLSEVFGNDTDDIDTQTMEIESVIPNPQMPPPKKYSNDVRMSQPQYVHQNSIPGNRQRTESITSVTSIKSMSEHGGNYSISRQSSYQPSEKQYPNPRNIQTQQSIERQQPPPSTASSMAQQPSLNNTNQPQKRVIQRNPPPKNNPFGDAKPVNTDKKVLTIQEQIMAEKNVEHQKGTPPPQIPQPQHSTSTNNQKYPEMVPGTIKIQKRPEGMLPPSQNGQMQFTNSMYAQQSTQFRHPGPPPSSHQQQQQHSRRPPPSQQSQPQQQQHSQQQSMPYPNHHVNLGDETIDVSKPPPMLKKHEEKNQQQQQRRPYNKKHSNYQHIPNGFNSNTIQQHQGSHNYTSHQSLPPAPPSRRKSSVDQRATSETIQTEKSQSAPVSHETVAMSQSSPRSSPSYNSLKRPNSANSSMSFVTAHSGSEMSSAMSTDLPCILDSVDSITERLSDITDEHRRHSWEGRDSPNRKNNGARKKNSLGSKRGSKKSTGNGEFKKPSTDNVNISRRSSASTPQYQSASNVFLDANEGSKATTTTTTEKDKMPSNETLPEPGQKLALIKVKNGLEKRAPSLPLSRPHTSSNEKTTNPPQLEEPNKPDSMSAPPTPIGPNKKKSEKSKKDNKRNSKSSVLQNNKFSALTNAPMGFE
jgi:hypothetical protein